MSLFLCLQGNTYHYRKAVPTFFRPLLGKREIKKSLHTGNKLEARHKALLLGGYIEDALKQTKEILMSKTISEKEIKKLLRDYFHYILDLESLSNGMRFTFAEIIRNKHSETTKSNDLDFTSLETLNESLNKKKHTQEQKWDNFSFKDPLESEAMLQELKEEHKSMSYETVRADIATRYPQLPQTATILDRFSLTGIEAQSLILERRLGNNPPIPNHYCEHQKIEDFPPVDTHSNKAPSPSLSKIIEEYTKDRLAVGRWTEKTKEENHALYNNFLDFAGKDIRCADINYHLISEFRDALKRLPANRKKAKKYRRKTIAQIIEMDVPNPMSITTVNKNLNRISTILNFAVKLGYMPTNPAEGMEIPITEKDSEQRNIFDNNDLQKLFNSDQYHNDSFLHPFMFWVCPIALFTGMRQTEIAQLHLHDIYKKNSVWVVDVNDNAKDKKVKNRNARRLIPLHSFLVNALNFPRYVKHMKEQGHKRLFPEISYGRDGYGQTVSRWFNGHGDGVTTGYKINCGITDGKKVFHSFRHTVIDHLKQKQVDGTLLHEFDGHSLGTMTYDRYGKAFNPELMYEKIVSQITFDKELDLAHLMKSKYVLDQY